MIPEPVTALFAFFCVASGLSALAVVLGKGMDR